MVVPVIVGVGRTMQRPQKDLEATLNPIQLAQIATEKALEDAQVGVDVVDAVMFINMLGEFRLPRKDWPAYDNPALSLANKIGFRSDIRCFLSEVGGNQPQFCVNDASQRISRGEFKACLITGAEAIQTLEAAKKRKFKLSATQKTSEHEKVLCWGDKTGVKPESIGSKAKVSQVQDLLHELTDMPIAYSMLEEETRRQDGVSHRERQLSNAKIFSGYNQVAVADENRAHSWFPVRRPVEEILQTSDSNRMVAYPYNKLMCSVMDVNQAASVLVMSDELARELGIPEQQWVYLHGSADCNDLGVAMLEKPSFSRCLGMKIVGEEGFRDANLTPSNIDFFDVYSCFPIAVRMACREMNLPVDLENESHRLTVTGGLPFHGGPGNNYVTHSIVAMVEKLRCNPGKFGLVTANGGILSKHSIGIYSTTPYAATHPQHPTTWTRPDCGPAFQQAKLAYPPRTSPKNPGNCQGVITNYTIKYGKGSKPKGVVIIGDITSGEFKGLRFVAKSEAETIVAKFAAAPEEFYSAPVSLKTKDVSGKGKAFLTTFQLVEQDSSIATTAKL